MRRMGRGDEPFRPGDPSGPPGGDGSSGGFGRFFGRVFENPDNPLGWSLRLFTASGIAVRIHLFTVLFVIVELLWSIPKGNAGLPFMAAAMASLLILVLLHEFGHCFACRFVGGSADRIVILPFGGLALCRPPERWMAHLITAAGGPLVNAALLPVFAAALWFAGLESVVLFNPFAPISVLNDPVFHSASNAAFWAKATLWWAHYINIVLLGFNLLLPAYPLDGGRILQAILWRRLGYNRATEITIYTGIAAAGALGVFGLAANETILVVIAVFAMWSCWVERKRLRGEIDLGGSEFAMGTSLAPADDLEDPWTAMRRAKRRQALAREQRELDRILAKIAESGMASLNRAEKRLLKRATDRKRREESAG